MEKTAGDLDVDGLTATELNTIGYNGWHSYELNLDNVRVPAENLVGGEVGRAFYHVMGFFEPARIHTAARAIGLAWGALEDSLAHAQDCEQFGQLIGEFQAIRFELASMATKIEAARQLIHYVATQKAQGKRCAMGACMAKYNVSEMAEEVSSEGIQIYSGNGSVTDTP